MIPAGYMLKSVATRPGWLPDQVDDLYSVSGHASDDFADYMDHWKHNGYWLFDSVVPMAEIAAGDSIDISGMTLFYYEVFEQQFDENGRAWAAFKPEASFPLDVRKPSAARLEGYDVVTFAMGNMPECSPLSCNSLAANLPVNRHGLLDTFEEARQALEAGKFDKSEPGPFRIFAVYRVEPAGFRPEGSQS
jgi:hypothetical protein